MMTGRREFAQRLRDERERSGVALRTIADSTKIPMSLLVALERGEIDKWPSGLFGRAHLRAYAAAIGLPAEEVLVDFLRLSGEASKGIAPPRRVQPSAPDGSFRLTLADDRRGTRSNHLTRIFDRAWRAALFRRAAD
jgi:cytoskeletal protein RodZ